jgi:hypothetical protein
VEALPSKPSSAPRPFAKARLGHIVKTAASKTAGSEHDPQ